MQFADITNGIAFCKIFGNEKKTAPLISFLNAALELEGDKRVVSVTLANPNLFPCIAGEKASILDVRATDQAGRKFVVEMQVAEKNGFDKRVQYYLSRDYSMQINKGEGLKAAFVEADKHNWSKDDLIAYDNVSIWEGDQRQERERVIQKAEEKGKDDKEVEMVVKLHLKGKSGQEISDLLDIPIERVMKNIQQYRDK